MQLALRGEAILARARALRLRPKTASLPGPLLVGRDRDRDRAAIVGAMLGGRVLELGVVRVVDRRQRGLELALISRAGRGARALARRCAPK
jgi:hypothetical protein